MEKSIGPGDIVKVINKERIDFYGKQGRIVAIIGGRPEGNICVEFKPEEPQSFLLKPSGHPIAYFRKEDLEKIPENN